MIEIIQYIRENNIPLLGICLGMQLMVIEYFRNVLQKTNANSLEFDENTNYDIITLLDEQKNVVHKGGTMRLGKQSSKISNGTIYELYSAAKRIQKGDIIEERFRHRYEVHPEL